MKKRALFICGSLNQTTMMHKIAANLPGVSCAFTPFYVDGGLEWLYRAGLLEFTILGGSHRKATMEYLRRNNLPLDVGGTRHKYDLVVTCTDLFVPRNIKGSRLLLVQEGITEPETWVYHLVRNMNLPLYLANTAATGLSDAYDVFCVASPGYRDFFVRKGIRAEKIVVTGIPNYDNAREYLENPFPYRGYVLVATSSVRETGRPDNRMQFLQNVKQIAGERPILFKLHPNENVNRATHEIRSVFPDAPIFSDGNTNHMIANCDLLITQYSTVVFTGIALGKEVYSRFDVDELRRLTPLQNNGASAGRIAQVCQQMINIPLKDIKHPQRRRRLVRQLINI